MSVLRGRPPVCHGRALRRGRAPRGCLAGVCSPTGPGLLATSLTSHPSQPGCLVLLLHLRVDGQIIYNASRPVSLCWLSNELADLYQWGEFECPTSVCKLSQPIFEAAQDPKRALDHIVKEIESRDPVQPGDDQAESELADKFLDLYMSSHPIIKLMRLSSLSKCWLTFSRETPTCDPSIYLVRKEAEEKI